MDQVVARLTGLLDREAVSADYVRLRIAVFEAQAAVLAELGDSAASPISETWKAGGPALGPETVGFDAALAERLFESITHACCRYGGPAADWARLRSAVRSRPGCLEELMRRAAFGPDEEYLVSLAERLEVSPELLLFLGRLLAAPFVTHAAGRLRQQGTAAPSPGGSCGSCPTCGSTPGLASLRPQDGGRVLHCSLCGQSWPCDRLTCPLCGCRDQSALARLAIAREDARWIEACDECRQYLQVVDRRRPALEEFIPLVEEVAGLYLDLVAEKEGYLRKPPYAAVG